MANHDFGVRRLAELPLFEAFSKRKLAWIDGLATDVVVDAGKDVCVEGEIGREFLVVLDGSFAVTRHGSFVATLHPGDWFGEMALSRYRYRVASVRTLSRSRLLAFSTREYVSMRRACPESAEKIDKTLLERARWIDDEVADPKAVELASALS